MSSSEAERRLRSSLASVSRWDVADTWRVLVEAELSGSTGSGPEPAAWEAAVGAAAGGRLGVHHHVYALYRLAQAQIAAGERLLAGSTLERAARLGQDKGLVRLVRLVEELSVRAGLDHNTRRTAMPYGSQLTSREQQVIALLAQGLTNRQIGQRLFISDKTASVHVSAIIRKLGVANRTDAAVRAAGLGLVTGRDEPAR